ncbi:MAG: DUF493 domain-containing protein [Gammaproteobacteria bacterium]|nr:DUF493 domain-containing protein [Gammaproteobacteria bacterium]
MQTPKITFPCDYPIRVIGVSSSTFLDDVLTIVCKYDDTMGIDKVKERVSRQGSYTSITLSLRATGEVQLQRMFVELKQCVAVRLVL